MTLTVVFRAQYLTETAVQMRRVDHNATHMVKAVKGLDLHPHAYTPVRINGKWVDIREANKDRAIEWFAEWAAKKVDDYSDEAVLVPIPSSKTVASSAADFRTAKIANAIAAKCSSAVRVAPHLRQRKATPSSREPGGTRDPLLIYPNLTLVKSLPKGPIILIDDVFTGGGHLKAAAWCLDDAGIETDFAICCGRTEHHQLDDPFKVDDEELSLKGKPPKRG